jgi:hypothetical protein
MNFLENNTVKVLWLAFQPHIQFISVAQVVKLAIMHTCMFVISWLLLDLPILRSWRGLCIASATIYFGMQSIQEYAQAIQQIPYVFTKYMLKSGQCIRNGILNYG